MERIASYDEVALCEITRGMLPWSKLEPAVVFISMYKRFFEKWQATGPGVIKTHRCKIDVNLRVGDFIMIRESRKYGIKRFTGNYILGLLKGIRPVKYDELSQEDREDVLYCYPKIDVSSNLTELTIDKCMLL